MLHRKFIWGTTPPVPTYTFTQAIARRSTQTTIYDYYGRSVAINDSSTTLFVGSDENSNANPLNSTAGPGRVYVYTKTAGVWGATPTQILTASDGVINDSFGASVACSSDGLTVIVGAPGAKIGSNTRQGAAYVYKWNPSIASWQQTAKLTAPDGTAEDAYGYSVSLSGDGSTAAVGAARDDTIPTYTSGSVYLHSTVTTFTGTASIDGNTLTVTGATSTPGLIGVGATVTGLDIPAGTTVTQLLTGTGGLGTYRISATLPPPPKTGVAITVTTSWTTSAKVTPFDGKPGDNFGCSVALSSTGNTVVIGASGADMGTVVNSGAVYTFTRAVSGSTVAWTQRSKVGSNVPLGGQGFGWSVDVDDAAAALLVGAPYANNTGCAYIFTPITVSGNTTWAQRAQIIGSDTVSGDRYGWSVSVGTGGRWAACGAPGANASILPPPAPPAPISESGAAYVHVNDGQGWVQTAKCVAGDAAVGDNNGYSVALTPDGSTLTTGAPFKSEPTGLPSPNTTRIAGAVYVFSQ